MRARVLCLRREFVTLKRESKGCERCIGSLRPHTEADVRRKIGVFLSRDRSRHPRDQSHRQCVTLCNDGYCMPSVLSVSIVNSADRPSRDTRFLVELQVKYKTAHYSKV